MANFEVGANEVKRNLASILSCATEEEVKTGKSWYPVMNGAIRAWSAEYGIPAEVIAGILAVTSPNSRFSQQLKYIPMFLRAYKAGIPLANVKAQTYNKNKFKTEAMLHSFQVEGILTGRKVTSFYQNLLLRDGVVTVDGWMARAAGMTDNNNMSDNFLNITPARYNTIENAIRELAEETGMTGYEMQAIVWIVIRRQWGYKD